MHSEIGHFQAANKGLFIFALRLKRPAQKKALDVGMGGLAGVWPHLAFCSRSLGLSGLFELVRCIFGSTAGRSSTELSPGHEEQGACVCPPCCSAWSHHWFQLGLPAWLSLRSHSSFCRDSLSTICSNKGPEHLQYKVLNNQAVKAVHWDLFYTFCFSS